jgi:hypothetical protein
MLLCRIRRGLQKDRDPPCCPARYIPEQFALKGRKGGSGWKVEKGLGGRAQIEIEETGNSIHVFGQAVKQWRLEVPVLGLAHPLGCR